jgi:hypothetical protein
MMAKKKHEEPGMSKAEIADLDAFWKGRTGGPKRKGPGKAATRPKAAHKKKD